MAQSPSERPRLSFWRALLSVGAMLALWWYFLLPYLDTALVVPTSILLRVLAPDAILGIEMVPGTGWRILSTLAPLEHPLDLLQFRPELTRFTVAFPLYWGLVAAAPVTPGARLYQLFVGTFLVVFPAAIIMATLFALFLVAMVIQHQPALTEFPPAFYVAHLPYPAWIYYLLGVGRQLSVLVLPTIVPLLTWGAFNLDVIRGMLRKTEGRIP